MSLAPAVAEDADDGPAVKAKREDGVVPTGRVISVVKRNWRERGYGRVHRPRTRCRGCRRV